MTPSLRSILFLSLAACGKVSDPAGGVDAGPRPDGGDEVSDDGHLTYTLGGDVYRLQAAPGATPENLSAQVAPGERADDRRINLAHGGGWIVFETSNLDPTCALCLAVAPTGDPAAAELVTPDGVPIIDAENLTEVGDDGDVVIFAAGGGPHARDLYRTRREAGGWSSATLLTVGSDFEWNDHPALHPDGTRVLFDCGPEANAAADGASICEVDLGGDAVTVVASPAHAPSSITHAGPLHHGDYAPDGFVFEADWDGERVWRRRGDTATPLTSLESSNDHSPCVLPDGRVASIYLGDTGNPDGLHELKLMNVDGTGATMLLRGDDVADLGLGCGE